MEFHATVLTFIVPASTQAAILYGNEWVRNYCKLPSDGLSFLLLGRVIPSLILNPEFWQNFSGLEHGILNKFRYSGTKILHKTASEQFLQILILNPELIP